MWQQGVGFSLLPLLSLFHFYRSLMCFVESGNKNPNNLALNIEKIPTSAFLFSAPTITTSSLKG